MKIDSIVKQYELKLEKQKEFYELKEYKLKEEVRELEARLTSYKSCRQSPRKRLD